MKNNTKNLKSYSAVAGAFLATGAVNAQIQYVDVNPDVIVDNSTPTYNLDMNVDGTDDFQFNVAPISGTGTAYYGAVNFAYSGMGASISGLNGNVNGYVNTSANTMNVAYGLSYGNAINSSGNFLSNGVLAADVDVTITGFYSGTASYQLGQFSGVSDAFVGVNFDINGNTHYGWIRLDVAATADMITIKDYAYSQIPDGGLNAGQMVGLEGIPSEDKVQFYTSIDQTKVNVTPDLLGSTLVVIDMAGNEVKSLTIEEIKTTIGYDNLDAGMYILSVKTDADAVSKKIYVR